MAVCRVVLLITSTVLVWAVIGLFYHLSTTLVVSGGCVVGATTAILAVKPRRGGAGHG